MRLSIILGLVLTLNLGAEPGVHSDFERSVILSNLATNVLNYTDRARRALQWSETMSANELIEKAISTTNEIEARTGANGDPARASILVEFEQPDFLRPIEQSTQQRPGYSATAASPLESAPSVTRWPRSPRIVRRTDTPYTSIILDAAYTRGRLESAQSALRWRDLLAADTALAAIQTNVDLKSVQWDQPLVRARQNLGISRAAALEGDRTLTESALRAAANALKDYEKSAPSGHAADAKALREQLTASADPGRITEWWHEVNGWIRTKPLPRVEPPGMSMPDPWPATWPLNFPYIPFT